MTFEQLRIFLAVAERQHVTRAAEALNLTQSAVSASIAALEAAHGVALFDRVGRRIVLTEAGRIFVPEARAVLDRTEGARVVLEDLSREPRGRLRLAASQTVASYWLPARMMALHAKYPGIELQLTVTNTATVAQSVRDGLTDMGLVEGPVSHQELHRQVVARDALVLVTAPGHPLSGDGPADPTRYSETGWILREEGSGTRSEFLSHLGHAGLRLKDLDVILEFPSNEAVLSAVAAGHGATVLSERAVADAVIAGRVVARPIPGGERPFTLLTNPARHRTRSVRAMLEILGL